MTKDKLNLTVWGIGTTRTIRVLWAMLELGLDYEHRPIGPRSGETQHPEYIRLNPKEKIPILQHGDIVISESAAIIQYLLDVFPPTGDFFIAKDAVTRAKLNEWCYFIISELDANSLYLIRRHDDLKHIYGAAPQAVASAQEYFLKYARAVTPAIENAGRYLMGEQFSVADILLMSCIDWALLYRIDPLPQAMLDYQHRVARRPAYQRAMRLNFPDWFATGGSVPEPLRRTLQAT